MEYENYRHLAAAIVLAAVNDFKKAAKQYKNGRNKEQALKTMKEVVEFIQSEWFKVLTDLDPQLVINKLKEELK